jgi:hypothetical protein
MAMDKLPKDDRPTYVLSYPRWMRLTRLGMVILLVGAALVRWVLAWVDFVRPLIQGGEAVALPFQPLIAVHVSLLLVAGAVAFVYAFLPDLSLADEGLAVHTFLGWHVVPWRLVTVVRLVRFEESNRQLVLVQGRWARWSPWPRLVSACLGAGLEPGLFFTSDIRDFQPLLGRLRGEVAQAAPEALFDEEFFSLPARLVLEPTVTLAGLTDQAREEGWPLALSAQAMAAVAGGFLLVQMLILILQGGVWWKPLAIVVLGAVEWTVGAIYLYALAEVFPANVEFRQAALLYPLSQIPRALLAVPMAMFVGAGVPFLAAIIGMAGILWAVTLTALLVQQMYRLQSILPALAGGALQALLQFLVLAVLFSR